MTSRGIASSCTMVAPGLWKKPYCGTGGRALASREAFRNADPEARAQLIAFLEAL